MKVIIKNENLYYLILPISLKEETEEVIITKVKNIFLNYNQKYNLLEPGFYEVDIYHHNLVGTILEIEKIDTFDFQEEVDLKVVIKDRIKIYLKLLDQTDFPTYKNKIDIDTLDIKEYLKLVEHSSIIIDTKKVLT